MEKEYYYPDLPWSIIKSYNLTLDKTNEICQTYEKLLQAL